MGLLFAVLEGDPQPSRVAIVALDGHVVADAQFQARQRPYVGNAAVPLQPAGQVIGSRVYYIDGYGTVRLLQANAQPRVVASFPQKPVQFETWFAVSHDGSRVLAGVLQFPAIGPVPSGCTGVVCFPPLIGPTTFDLMSVTAGSQAKTLQHFDSSQLTAAGGTSWSPTFPVGWISAGAVAMVPLSISTQNAWYGGPLFVVDESGKQVQQVGGADCLSASITSSKFVACTDAVHYYHVTVRDLSGQVLWTPQLEGFSAAALYLSPDGNGIANNQQVETRKGGVVSMAAMGFQVEGWLDNNTIVGRKFVGNTADRGDLLWIRLSDPTTIHDFGFKADFVGTLTSPG